MTKADKEGQRKTPILRFKGFTDDWEQRKLGEVATFINGRAYKQNELLDSGKYKVLRVGNFYTNDSWYYSNLELADKYYIDKDDLVYTWSATFGPHIWNGEKVIYHYHIWKIELSKFLDRDFTLQILEADKAKLLANTNGSTMIHVTKKDMESKVISLPTIEEQKQIGLYLTKFDTLITLYDRKLKLLSQVKKYFLDNLFAEKEYPNLRFKGFTDAWERRKLGKQNKITMGQSPSSKNYTDNPNDWILIQGNADLKNGKVAPRLYTSQVTKKADIGDIILTVRAPVGEVAITDYNAVLGRGVAAIKGNLFIYFALEKFKANNKWNMYSSGSTFDSITGKDLNNLPLFFPSETEANKIGVLLNKLDNLLALYENKKQNLIEIKKSLLNTMFI